MYKKKQKIEIFINFILAVLAIGIFHMFIARKGALALYATEQQIPLAFPFNSLIPIWISLYLILGISGAFIYIKRATQIRSFAMASWTIQLVLCILWPISFYYIPFRVVTPIVLSILFMTNLVFMFYSFLIEKKVVLITLPFFLMVSYQMMFHWILFIINIDIA